jgi:hypothetical protein
LTILIDIILIDEKLVPICSCNFQLFLPEHSTYSTAGALY